MQRILALVLSLPLCAQIPDQEALAAQAAQFSALMRGAQRLPLQPSEFPIQPPSAGWAIEMVSSVAVDPSGAIYLLQRGAKADPVIVADRQGRILRSWGKGLYKIPHSIRVDPNGDLWTVDAGSSMVYKFTREGKKLLEIDVGGLPVAPRSEFCGTTDIAFAPGGRILISDGYANARILEYNTAGKRIREWGMPGTGPGQFRLPHGIAIDRDGIVYVADRENGRIQRFSLEGRYIGEWGDLGKTFSLKITPAGDLWIGTQPRNVPNGSEGWIVKVDRRTGKVLGAMQSGGTHSIEVNPEGEPMTGVRPDKVFWFRAAGR
jgi:DNA-binding beta-propeller fold protein YncE